MYSKNNLKCHRGKGKTLAWSLSVNIQSMASWFHFRTIFSLYFNYVQLDKYIWFATKVDCDNPYEIS
jgi:hypothetical protein